MAVRLQCPKRAIESRTFDGGVGQGILPKALGNFIAIRFLLLFKNPQNDWLDKAGDVSHCAGAWVFLAALFTASPPGLL